MTKLIFDKETHRVIGGAIVGTNGGELLGEIGLAIEMGCDAEDIALTIHAHPTLHESVGLAAEGLRRQHHRSAKRQSEEKVTFSFRLAYSGSRSRFFYA